MVRPIAETGCGRVHCDTLQTCRHASDTNHNLLQSSGFAIEAPFRFISFAGIPLVLKPCFDMTVHVWLTPLC